MKHLSLVHGAPWSGLIFGAGSWLLDTQINYALVEWSCAAGTNPVPMIAVFFTVTSLAGAAISWRAWPRFEGPGLRIPEQDGHPHYLICGVGVAAGVLFAIVIALQGIAGLIVGACQR
jgi:hypothetical protein